MEKLKKCPFCGGKAEYDNDVGNNDDYFVEFIACTDCGSKAHNAEIWNRRK